MVHGTQTHMEPMGFNTCVGTIPPMTLFTQMAPLSMKNGGQLTPMCQLPTSIKMHQTGEKNTLNKIGS